MARHGAGFLVVLAAASVLAALALAPPEDGTVRVGSIAELRRALAQARLGTRILVAPGEYTGGFYAQDVHGAPGRPVVIAAAEPARPPVFRGGNGVQFSDVSYVELRDLIFAGAAGNGLNIDDGGTFATPSHHVTLQRLTVRDVGPRGNHDGIKLSGVDDFRVDACVIERWGDDGSAIDMVGCHRGVIERCRFAHGDATGGSGVQAKGGSREIAVRRCRFEHAGQRAVNLGGSTGLEFFRPKPQGYEAADLQVEGNVFVGSMAPVAFVGVDGATVRFNTLYRPKRWALRILQETVGPAFVPCRNGRFTDNAVVFRAGELAEAVNIGPNTQPASFRFAHNLWYCQDRPARSRPALPSPETGGIVGEDPRLRDPERGDFQPLPNSPAATIGAHAYHGGE